MTRRPTARQLTRALGIIGVLLATRRTRYHAGRFVFPLDGGWSLAISPDDAGRFRVEACVDGWVRATMWCLADDHRRLAELAISMRSEATALVAS